jgi:hypothetical protein
MLPRGGWLAIRGRVELRCPQASGLPIPASARKAGTTVPPGRCGQGACVLSRQGSTATASISVFTCVTRISAPASRWAGLPSPSSLPTLSTQTTSRPARFFFFNHALRSRPFGGFVVSRFAVSSSSSERAALFPEVGVRLRLPARGRARSRESQASYVFRTARPAHLVDERGDRTQSLRLGLHVALRAKRQRRKRGFLSARREGRGERPSPSP